MIVAAVPVKQVERAKSRLAPSLGPAERRALVLAMLDRTVHVLRASGRIDRIALVTRLPELAARVGAVWLGDAGSLNASLQGATRWADAAGAEGLLIMPIDLPLVEPDDITALIDAVRERPGVGLNATADGGTGALYLTPPAIIDPRFGENSAERHRGAARNTDVPLFELERPGLARDLDVPRDLAELRHYLPDLCLLPPHEDNSPAP